MCEFFARFISTLSSLRAPADTLCRTPAHSYHSDEASFLVAYPQAEQGHTALPMPSMLHAVSEARENRGHPEAVDGPTLGART